MAGVWIKDAGEKQLVVEDFFQSLLGTQLPKIDEPLVDSVFEHIPKMVTVEEIFLCFDR